MRRKMQKGFRLTILLVWVVFIQKSYAQKETFFHHFNWTQHYLTAAGTGAQGFALNSLYRNFNDSINYYFSMEAPFNKLNSAVGLYYLHNSSGNVQNIRSGLSYTGFIHLGQNSNLRLGLQGNRHQQALSAKTWAFQEYQTDTVFYTGDASIFLQRRKLSLGFSIHNLLPLSIKDQQHYLLFIGFNELRTSSWLRSSPYMLMQVKPTQQVPEWYFNYTATIANTLMLGASYYKNSDYLYGLHAGFKLFNTVWLTGATDFVDTRLPYRAIYELGLRFNIWKNRPIDSPAVDRWQEDPGFQSENEESKGF